MSSLRLLILFGFLFSAPIILSGQELISNEITYGNNTYQLYPATYSKMPEVMSPVTLQDGTEIIISFTQYNEFALIPVTFENGGLLDYKTDHWYGKGLQTDIDSIDFPTLAITGLHSEDELLRTKTITGKPISEITRIGRPERYSGAGFMSQDEDIISVLLGDNRIISRLEMTHPQMARQLFHIFNLILQVKTKSEYDDIKGIIYNKRKIFLKFHGAKGWQESIFNDEILGYWQLDIWTTFNQSEKEFLLKKYPDLSDSEMRELISKLSIIHTGEMVPFYIMRYGFYEGHTSYRADPIAIAFIFGLRSIRALEKAFPGELYEKLKTHFTEEYAKKR